MRQLMVTLVVVGAVIGQQGNSTQEDLKKMQGQWTIKTIINGGKEDKNTEENATTWTIKDNKITYGEPVVWYNLIQLDATKVPKTLDSTTISEKEKDSKIKGIYKFEGDTLVFCIDVDGKSYPAAFESPAGSTLRLITLTRMKK